MDMNGHVYAIHILYVLEYEHIYIICNKYISAYACSLYMSFAYIHDIHIMYIVENLHDTQEVDPG